MEEERLTEAEWREREVKRTCAAEGHDWTIVSGPQYRPILLVCDRGCGHPGYNIVERRSQPNDATSAGH